MAEPPALLRVLQPTAFQSGRAQHALALFAHRGEPASPRVIVIAGTLKDGGGEDAGGATGTEGAANHVLSLCRVLPYHESLGDTKGC